MDNIKTPNLDKLKEIEPVLDEIQGFMDWLMYDRNIILGVYVSSHTDILTGTSSREKILKPYELMTVDELLKDYAGINIEALEQEKRQIVEAYMKRQRGTSD